MRLERMIQRAGRGKRPMVMLTTMGSMPLLKAPREGKLQYLLLQLEGCTCNTMLSRYAHWLCCGTALTLLMLLKLPNVVMQCTTFRTTRGTVIRAASCMQASWDLCCRAELRIGLAYDAVKLQTKKALHLAVWKRGSQVTAFSRCTPNPRLSRSCPSSTIPC